MRSPFVRSLNLETAIIFWWDARDSNPESTGYEPGALTNYANVPNKKEWLMIKYIVNFTISQSPKTEKNK